ncbi:MAG: GtrA family protein, partial [Tissierellia bacterium]|nr:GtrA family protein [Tissierellia bacterium]
MPSEPAKKVANIDGNKNIRKEVIRGIKFTLFSLSAGLIQIITFSILNEFTNWRYSACYLVALTLSVLWNFTLNRRYTFRSSNNVSIAMGKTFAFYLVFTPVSTIIGDYLVETLLLNEYFITIAIMISNFVLEFLYDRFFVFYKS